MVNDLDHGTTAENNFLSFICAKADFHHHLASVSRAVASRPALPILSNVLLEADGSAQRVALTAFDLSLGIRSEFDARVLVGGRITLPAKLLGDIVSRLPGGEVSLQEREGCGTTLSWTGGQYQLRGLSASDYPALPEIRGQEGLEVSIESLLQGISQTLFAASTDETKQVLTGVHITWVQDEGEMEFAATDGHRLATVKAAVGDGGDEEGSFKNLELTIPVRTLRELDRILSNQTASTLSIRFDASQIQFGLERQVITSRLLDGQYPDYRRLIPSKFERQVTVERKPLLEALERIAIFAAQKNDIIKFSLSESAQRLGISTEAPDVGSGEEFLSVQCSGSDLDIAFNVKYLLDVLKVMNTQEVKFSLNGSTQPVVWQPIGAMQLKYLVMPVQIRT
jgi:DNA polymerase-3 subunit beta